ncbi:MAG: general secretion pathway protein GspK [Simplicispira sp.]|nr:general secretion pathway protein GspK [Simplicispira sp.]
MKQPSFLHAGPQRGIALIAVLWIVAALSVIVTGVVHSVRSEVRLVSVARQSVQATALGEAAIVLVLQDMAARGSRPAHLTKVEVTYQGQPMAVEVMPLTGLIDINRAPVALLTSLYAVAGELDAKSAQTLAEATVQMRSERDARGREVGFEAEQDLLRVPGVGYDLYAKIFRLVTAQAQGSGRVNPQAAPEGVLRVLAGGNAARATALAAARDKNPADLDSTALNGEFLDNASSSRYRLQAQVALPDAGLVFVERSADLRPDFRLGLPWRIFNAEHWMQAAPAQGA